MAKIELEDTQGRGGFAAYLTTEDRYGKSVEVPLTPEMLEQLTRQALAVQAGQANGMWALCSQDSGR